MNQMSHDIDCVFEGFGGRGRIYISGIFAAQNNTLLKNLDIKCIISAAEDGLLLNRTQDILHYLYVPAKDSEDYDLKAIFDQTFKFIEKGRKETNVLVHCMAGISRSATLVIAYLIRKYTFSLSTVLPMIKRRRAKINPNHGFLKQLQTYANELGIKNETQPYLKHQRIHSFFQSKKKQEEIAEESSINPQNSDDKNKQTRKNLKNECQNDQIQTNINIVEEKINILREKVMEMSKLRSKHSKYKNVYRGGKYEGLK